MRILIDAHMLNSREGGNERYIKNLAYELANKGYCNVFCVVSSTFSKKNEFSKKINYIKLPKDNNLLRIFWYLPTIAREVGADIIHSTYIGPFFTTKKVVLMVHDMGFMKHSTYFNLKELFGFKFLLPLSIKKASAIIVPSNFSKNELLKYYPSAKNKVFVTKEAADPIFKIVSKKKAKQFVEKKLGISKDYILVLNSKIAKKNIGKVIKAFNLVKENYPELELVIVGEGKSIMKRKNGIKILGYVKDEDLLYLYNAAAVFVYYSLYEGFGLPVLEAISCGTNVIASDIKAIKEVTKGRVALISPQRPMELAQEIAKALRVKKTSGEAKKLIKEYSWQITADTTFGVYKKVLKQ